MQDYELLDIFLFEVILIGSFGHLEHVFHMPKRNLIFIEIANTWNNKIEKNLSIIRLFNKKTVLDMKNISNLEVKYDLQSPMQIVCNYLKAFDDKTLKNRDIKIFAGDPNYNIRPLSNTQCYNLIKKYFLNDNPDATFR